MGDKLEFLPKIKVCVIGHDILKEKSLGDILSFWLQEPVVDRKATVTDTFQIPFDMKNSMIGLRSSGDCVLLEFVDTNNRSKQLRRVSFPNTDVFLIVSLEAHKEEWIAEIH